MRAAALLPALLLVGCTGLTNSFFDPIEASRYADVAYFAKVATQYCTEADVMPSVVGELKSQTDIAVNCTTLKVANARLAKAGSELQALVNEMEDRYSKTKPSEGYCKLKLAQISVGAEQIAKSIGKKEE